MLRLAAACLLLAAALQPAARSQTVQHIDLYGVRDVPRADVLDALDMNVGDPTEGLDRPAAAERLRQLDGIEDAVVIAMFIPGNEILLVGVRETGAPELVPRAEPTGDARLPQALVDAYEAASDLGYEGMLKGVSGESNDGGFSMPDYAPAAERVGELAELARAEPERVLEVLRDSGDAYQRAVAARALAALDDKAVVVAGLEHAMTDVDSGVRNNAIRALSVLAGWANGQDDVSVDVDPAPLLVLLESLEWTDRNKAAALLDKLCVARDPELLEALRASSLPALSEMARWHSRAHALFSVRILGRLAGLAEGAIEGSDAEARARGDEVLDQWIDGLTTLAERRGRGD